MKKIISSDVVIAYSQCTLKAYKLLFTNNKGIPHEYISILEEEAKKNRIIYFSKLKKKNPDGVACFPGGMKKGTSSMVEASIEAEDVQAYADVLSLVEESCSKRKHRYIPTLIVGTHKISKEQKLQLAFIGYVLDKFQEGKPSTGIIVGGGNIGYTIQLEILYKEVGQILRKLREWSSVEEAKIPPVILNKHCPLCPFLKECEEKANELDHLSLLDNISTSKHLKKYERKGIFTINQLSYLYRPRKQRKRSRNLPALKHRLELQAAMIRTGKIYLHETPQITRNPVELFLDIEGTPDRNYFYLIGVLVCSGDTSSYYPFWADNMEEETKIWHQFLHLLERYPYCPIYHYGNYEQKTIITLGKRYDAEVEKIIHRLINVNNYIYGKIYFPLRSNGLKEIGKFIGASWTSPDASGLQSLVWRYHWERSQNPELKQQLQTYNCEDCQALKLLTDFLSNINEGEEVVSNIDSLFLSRRSRSTKIGSPLHYQLEEILEFAHTNYNKNKINFREQKNTEEKIPRKTAPKKRYRVTRTVHLSQKLECPQCGSKNVYEYKKKIIRIQVDLVFTKNGVRKSTTKYCAFRVYCRKCEKTLGPIEWSAGGRAKWFGPGFKIWVVYQRVALRTPYRNISMTVKDLFNEDLSLNGITRSLREIAQQHTRTEEQIIKELLDGPFLHVDETQINIDNVNQYIWVFTNGKYVIFKHTETREASFVHEFLAQYTGVLISDFYSGFDALNCKHQKCWVHIIRDLNNDLWANPFDVEFGNFVSEVKDLIVPIMESIQKHGLKKRHLNKFKNDVDRFYFKTIIDHSYDSELCSQFQERFIGYRESLFTFLEYDGIPWHNNPAENAIRHIILQMDISGRLHKSAIEEYLILLGIRQTCKFQNKSFLQFLLSGGRAVDLFNASTSKKHAAEG